MNQIIFFGRESGLPLEVVEQTENYAHVMFNTLDLVIFKLLNSTEADAFALNLNSALEQQGFIFQSRLMYKALSYSYARGNPVKKLFLLKQDKFVLLLKET